MNSDKLKVDRIAGSVAEASEAYGERFERLIMGFCKQEVRPEAKRLAYARRCWPWVVKQAPMAGRFVQGMARGARLPLEHMALMSLMEEVAHQPHCTAFAAGTGAVKGAGAVLGQNWDLSPAMYPWAGLLKLSVKGDPAMALYHYPGTWACMGVNEEGLGLVWTSTGFLPKVAPKVGVGTYALVYEVLRRKNVAAALEYLKGVRNAGAFNFLLGDVGGRVCVAESVPGRMVVDESANLLTRGNHYACGEMCGLTKQKLVVSPFVTSVPRAKRMEELTRRHAGKVTVALGKEILLDREGPGPWIHQFPCGPKAGALHWMSLDSLVVDCRGRALVTCRGGREPGAWQRVSV